jgi:prophage antirepressor-like protein
MNNELQIFNFGSKKIQEITDEENINWFVASDICEALEIKDVSRAVERLDEEDKKTIRIQTAGGLQPIIIVNEFGLTALIFSSRKEKAKPFKHWFSHECLQALKKPVVSHAEKIDYQKELDLMEEHCTKTKVRAITAQLEYKYCPSEEKDFYAEKEEKVRFENIILNAIYDEGVGHRYMDYNSIMDICFNLDEKQIKETIARLLEKESIDKKNFNGEIVYFLYSDEYTRLFLSTNGQKAIG